MSGLNERFDESFYVAPLRTSMAEIRRKTPAQSGGENKLGGGEEDLMKKESRETLNKEARFLEELKAEIYDHNVGGTPEMIKSSEFFFSDKIDEIADHKRDLWTRQKHLENNPDDPLVKFIRAAYDSLHAYSVKSMKCLQTLSDVGSFSENVSNMSSLLDEHVSEMPDKAAAETNGLSGSLEDGICGYLKCIHSLEANWATIGTLLHCLQIQCENASAYHQFYHELIECRNWLGATHSQLRNIFDERKYQGTRQEALALLSELTEVLDGFLQWEARIENLKVKSKNICPMKQRVTPVSDQLDIISLADYQTEQITIEPGEDLKLLDNTLTPHHWKVSNIHGSEGLVPAIILQIPPEDPLATSLLLKLHDQLSATWHGSGSTFGKKLLAFLLKVFRDWNNDEISIFQSLPASFQKKLSHLLQLIDSTLSTPEPPDQPKYEQLQDKLNQLKFILDPQMADNTSNGKGVNDDESKELIVQDKAIEDLLNKYSDFLTYFDNLNNNRADVKVLVGTDGDRNVISTAYINKYKTGELPLNAKGNPFLEPLTVSEEDALSFSADETSHLAESPVLKSRRSEFEEAVEAAEQLVSSEQQEDVQFTIRAVVNPETKEEISLQEAMDQGIIDSDNGVYVDKVNGTSMPIPEAMSEGLIQVEVAQAKKSVEKKQTVGLLTIRTTKHNINFTIKEAMDTRNGKFIPLKDAVRRGIIDGEREVFIDKKKEKEMSLAEAVKRGLVIKDDEEDEDEETVTKTYAVHAVIDHVQDRRVSFNDACSLGILNVETGIYKRRDTGQEYHVPEAIAKGFLKAKEVSDEDTTHLDIAQKVTIEKFDRVRSKLSQLKTLGALKSFQKK